MFSKKATKIDKIVTVDLPVTPKCQIDSEDFVNFFGLLRNMNFNLSPCLYILKARDSNSFQIFKFGLFQFLGRFGYYFLTF